MAEREVRVGVATFRQNVQADTPLWGFGLHGQKVDVHEDDLERFDRLNGPAVTVQPDLPGEVSVVNSPAEPPRAGKGSGLDAWVEYAESLDLLVPENATRDEVIALVDDSK